MNNSMRVFSVIAGVLDAPGTMISVSTPLLGEDGILDSMRIVEVCLALEDIAIAAGASFDWTSDSAMSRSRSVFRTAGSLADEFERQIASGS